MVGVSLTPEQYKELQAAAQFARGMTYPTHHPHRRHGPFFMLVRFSGIVVFKTQNGKQVPKASFAGAPTDFIRCWYAGATPGLVEYSDGTDLQNWPDGAQVYQISQLKGNLFVP